MELEVKRLTWLHGSAEVQNLGGMLGPAKFRLSNGKVAEPLHVAPWSNDGEAKDLPGILRSLRGEWPCVPFGMDAQRDVATDWLCADTHQEIDQDPHGFSSNNFWSWGECTSQSIELYIDYPASHPIKRLTRIIRACPNAPAIDIELRVQVRTACRLPIGIHATFALSSMFGEFELNPGAYESVLTYPGDLEPQVSCFVPNQKFKSLNAIETREGEMINACSLPLKSKAEDLLQVLKVDGRFGLINHKEKYEVKLTWQSEHFNSVLLWFSNGGRGHYPWNGTHYAIGIEPICSAFDFGPAISNSTTNPLSKLGIDSSFEFDDSKEFSTQYRIEAFSVP